ncbi:MAG: tandem-95 repeat protein [Alphaproteobacteria bacterium]|nr:tandem-95 repeat protein [Alphaproteobacteria bacterium]
MSLFSFGRWGWLGTEWLNGFSWRGLLETDAASSLRGDLLMRDTGLPQPPPQVPADGTGLPGSTFGTLGAEAPVIWLLPQDEAPAPVIWLQPESALAPLGGADGDSVALASFLTPTGDHINFISSQPAFGLGAGLFIDADTRTILTEGERAMGDIGSGSDDQLVLGGGNANVSLAGFGAMFERVVLMAGSDYTLTAAAGSVAPGHTLTVSAEALGAANHLSFDGSGETSGHFVLLGGDGDDVLTGGGGADVIAGGAGADMLAGGAGADRFVYMSAGESTGSHYDTILDFSFGSDVIDLPGNVTGLDAAVTKGALSQGSFDADLAAALGPAALAAGHALFFTPDSGQLAGQTFLVVDANGEAGYQAGVDYVIHFASAPPVDLHGTGFFA